MNFFLCYFMSRKKSLNCKTNNNLYTILHATTQGQGKNLSGILDDCSSYGTFQSIAQVRKSLIIGKG